ncbi:3-deoxy-D-manno-octulosonate cytidylyltransferase [Saprolegnia parasitica CBS 223.65]|uniref:3-deoxy-D-manno-octulosonate cytidylyltransferase n=1 Tax=Saprolegnia parasitica (strain CBS 223.65) TaxID=695850 RepID=A0A067BPZ7_SAPPC|nr:3-deoxy-D-manno-octulosonate cytidylyltransferase [Saprolegnia parasitica CBS 223.65]KDO20328.1 3-deoxy-D-manno-octulosonate cytidylyltransferase [Saprolegnia parasitica CBS 223.65]|eukprot:XP_012208996.1 3-deoxy-D-manno-octulosonate cytidylyltransferase [Saprolegnia parasitica CBS 223.65]
MRAIGIIPARLRSTRFHAKPLALLCGTPMIKHTFEAASRATKLDAVYVATDAIEIASLLPSASILTDAACANGTERVLQALARLPQPASLYDIVVNIQGDEPGIDPAHIDLCVAALEDDPSCVMSTLMAPVRSEAEARSFNVVKVVANHQSHAMYFSRALIPASKDNAFDPARTMKHIGLYAFRTSFLVDVFPTLTRNELGDVEDLEQLRVLEAGHKIKMVTVQSAHPGVDVPDDLLTLEAILSTAT